jgi:hypothetical protein
LILEEDEHYDDDEEGVEGFDERIKQVTMKSVLKNRDGFIMNTKEGENKLREEQHNKPPPWIRIIEKGASILVNSRATEAERIDYFSLCLAAHFATVASYVPTGKNL